MKLNNIFSICPKSYFAICQDSAVWKRSSKGVQHSEKLNYADFKTVIYSDSAKTVNTKTIRLHENTMKTMISRKIGLRNVQIKNFVETDRITTRPFTRNAKFV